MDTMMPAEVDNTADGKVDRARVEALAGWAESRLLDRMQWKIRSDGDYQLDLHDAHLDATIDPELLKSEYKARENAIGHQLLNLNIRDGIAFFAADAPTVLIVPKNAYERHIMPRLGQSTSAPWNQIYKQNARILLFGDGRDGWTAERDDFGYPTTYVRIINCAKPLFDKKVPHDHDEMRVKAPEHPRHLYPRIVPPAQLDALREMLRENNVTESSVDLENHIITVIVNASQFEAHIAPNLGQRDAGTLASPASVTPRCGR